jgi:hypothetical protein
MLSPGGSRITAVLGDSGAAAPVGDTDAARAFAVGVAAGPDVAYPTTISCGAYRGLAVWLGGLRACAEQAVVANSRHSAALSESARREACLKIAICRLAISVP